MKKQILAKLQSNINIKRGDLIQVTIDDKTGRAEIEFIMSKKKKRDL